MNHHTIAQTQSWGQGRVDGVRRLKFPHRRRPVELGALEVDADVAVAVLLRVLDDAAVAIEELGHGHVDVYALAAQHAERGLRATSELRAST